VSVTGFLGKLSVCLQIRAAFAQFNRLLNNRIGVVTTVIALAIVLAAVNCCQSLVQK
jgi:hypothetical protein